MPIGSSIAGQVGLAIETVPGTRTAPTTFVEITSEGLAANRGSLRSNTIGGGGSIVKPARPIGQEPGGSLSTLAAPENIGKLLRLCFGAPVTTGTGPYTHTFTWTLANQLPTATVQIGKPSTDGTVRPFDFVGMMAASWEMGVSPDEYVTMNYDLQGRYVLTNQTLATPTWPTLTEWTSFDASLTLLGGEECFNSLTINGNNNLNMSKVVCGTNPGQRRVRQAGRPTLGGVFNQDFEDMELFDAFVAGTVGDFSLELDAGTTARLTLAGRVQFNSDNTPTIGGPEEILTQAAGFEFVRDTTDAAAFSAVLVNSVASI